MKHQNILNHLASRSMVRSMDEDFALSISRCHNPLDSLLIRWNNIFLANSENVSQNYRDKAIIAWVTLCHKYGVTNEPWLNDAFLAIDRLNDDVVLSDKFYHSSDKIKAFLQIPPTPLKRRPSVGEFITFFRKGDVIAINIDNRFFIAYVHQIIDNFEAPHIEFYEKVFDHLPTWEEVAPLRAGTFYKYKDTIERVSNYGVFGLKYVSDPANQVHLIASNIQNAPNNQHLQPSIGLWALYYFPELVALIKRNYA